MKTLWIIVAACCGVCAAFFLVQKDIDKAFIVATAGAVAWFLSYRVQMKNLVGSSTEPDLEEGRTEVDDDETN